MINTFDPAYGTILLICDTADARDETTLIVSSLGYELEFAESGAEGLMRLSAGVHLLRAVIVDLHADEAAGGTVARLIRNFFPSLALLLIGASAPEELSLLRRLGPRAQFLAHPFTPTELAQALAALLAEAA